MFHQDKSNEEWPLFYPSLVLLTHGPPGVLGGKFLTRGHVKKPGQELFKSEPSEYFTAQDLYVGATLCLNNKKFQLLDADEYTFKYMEQHSEEVGRKLYQRFWYCKLVLSGDLWSRGLELTWLQPGSEARTPNCPLLAVYFNEAVLLFFCVT